MFSIPQLTDTHKEKTNGVKNHNKNGSKRITRDRIIVIRERRGVMM